MRSLSKLSIDEKIAAVENRFTIVKNHPGIMSHLTRFNIDEIYFTHGLSLVNIARDANNKQKTEYSEQYQATNERDLKLDEIEEEYQLTAGIAKLALKNDSIISGLKLNIDLPYRIGAKIERIRSFYSGILDNLDHVTAMNRFGKEQEALEAEQAEVEVLATIHQKQQKEKGEAQYATQVRDEAVEKMLEKDYEFQSLLKLALGKHNDLLEAAGLFVRS